MTSSVYDVPSFRCSSIGHFILPTKTTCRDWYPALSIDIVMAIDVDQKLLKQTKFPTEFNQKVDMQKVNLEVMKK